VLFAALGLHGFLAKKHKDAQARQGKDEPGMTRELFKLEKKLNKWIDLCFLTQILDWFDCFETTVVQTAICTWRWSTESVLRDRLLLKYLGVTRE